MNGEQKQPEKIDLILVGDRIAAGGYTVEPVARAQGFYGGGDSEQGRGFGSVLKIRPLEVRVSGPGGVEQTVPITDPTGEAVRGIAKAGLVVAAISALLLLLNFLRRRR